MKTTTEEWAWMNPERNPEEWDRAFNALPSGPVYMCPDCGETWQYMGTVRRTSGEVVHNFRHRHSPTTGRRLGYDVRASEEFIRTAIFKPL